MAKRAANKGEERLKLLLDKYGGDLSAATIWEVSAVLQQLHVNHGYYAALEALYWDKAWARWQGEENELAPSEALLPRDGTRCEMVTDSPIDPQGSLHHGREHARG